MNSYTVTLYPYTTPTAHKWRFPVLARDRADACNRAYQQLRLTTDAGQPMWADCDGVRTEIGTTTHRRMS